MNRNPLDPLGLSEVEITPEIITRRMAEARRLHDEAIVAFVKRGVSRITHGVGRLSRLFFHERAVPHGSY